MKLSNLLAGTIAAGALASLVATIASSAHAADRDYVVRAVPASSGPHEVFMRLVKVPKVPADAENHDDRAMQHRVTSHDRDAARTPKG